MQTKPAGWPADQAVEDVPEVRARFRSSAWPPARDGMPAGQAAVGEWSIDRNLTGGGLPGQARGASGGSIAQGSFTFPQPQGAPLSPFTADGLEVQAGGLIDVTAWQGNASLPLGSFQSQSVSGASTNGAIDVDIEEATQRLKRPFTYQWFYDPKAPTLDASHIMEAAASAGGYVGSSAPLNPSHQWVLLGSELNGRAIASSGGVVSTPLVPRWGTSDGRIGLSSGMMKLSPSGNETSPGFGWSTSEVTFFVEVGAAGGVVEIAQSGGADGLRVGFGRGEQSIVIRRMGVQSVIASYPITLNQESHSFLVHMIRPSASSAEVTIRICQDEATTWTTLGTFTVAGLHAWSRQDTYTVGWFTVTHQRQASAGWVRGFQAYSGVSDYAALAALPLRTVTARIAASGSLLHGVFDLADKTCWDIIQEAARSTMGGAWMDERGAIIYRDRESLRSGVPVETMIAEERLDTLAWDTSIEDMADRVELAYTPAEVVSDPLARVTLWEADRPYIILARKDLEIVVDIEGSTDRISAFLPLWDTTTAGEEGSQMSRWAAAYRRDGDGERPGDNAIRINATMVGPSKVKLRVMNRTDNDLWLVDGRGNPCLILRSTLQVAPGEQITVASGNPEARSISPFSFDAGMWVQTPDMAQEMLDWLTSQTAQPEPTIPGVGVKPDLARQLGDIVVVTDETTQLRSKALITAVHLSGSSSGYTQNVTMALLAETFRSLDAYTVAQGVSTFQDIDTALATADVQTFTQFDAWCRKNLVTY